MIGSGIGVGVTRPAGLSRAIRSLFASSEKGVWFDPSDFSTMFQDSAGTTPVTAVGQPVGKILDKSGNSFHATQPTSTARPTLGRHPITGVRNLLVGTDALATQSYTTTAVAYTLSFTGTGTVTLSGAYVGSLVGTGTSNRVSLTFTSTAASLTLTVSGSVTFAQLERGSAVTNYQSAVTQFDITEAGVNSAYYLYGDGVDNSMVTPSIDFTATNKMSVFVGAKKLSDAAIMMLTELGPNDTTAGTFYVVNPVNTAGNYRISSFGSGTGSNQRDYGPYLAPVTHVISTSLSSVAADSASAISARINGGNIAGTSFVSKANTGNYGNFPLNLLSRAGTSFPFLGNLYGLIVRGALSSATEIAAAEQWMNSKTGAY